MMPQLGPHDAERDASMLLFHSFHSGHNPSLNLNCLVNHIFNSWNCIETNNYMWYVIKYINILSGRGLPQDTIIDYVLSFNNISGVPVKNFGTRY